jgi:hypothetical protein
MAVDTRDKRASAFRLFPRIRPTPDGGFDAADRRHIGGFYRGIAATLPEGGDIPCPDPEAGESTVGYCLTTLTGGESIQDYCLTTLEGGASI